MSPLWCPTIEVGGQVETQTGIETILSVMADMDWWEFTLTG